MKKVLLFTILSFFSYASSIMASSCGEEAQDILQETYPAFSYETVGPTPIDDLCEVVSDKNTLYFAPATGHLVFGEIWSKEGRNITAEEQGKRVSTTLSTLSLSKAVHIGSGPNTVIEFTDPDCPFCRKGSEFFAARTDVTRYIFFLPLDRLHPDAARKAEYILAADDQASAYELVISGFHDHAPLPAFQPSGLLAEHRDIAAELNVSSTPRYWINGQPVSGFNPTRIEQILKIGAGRKTAGKN